MTTATPLDVEATCFAPEELTDAASRVEVLLRLQGENRGLREDNAHLLRTARQATTAVAHERLLRERLEARLAAADRYLVTSHMARQTRLELLALLHGHTAQT